MGNELKWRKASRSHAQGDNCVEVAAMPGTTAIRDSKNPSDGLLFVSREDARALSERIKGL
ncbi:DUF397 domain-containing protein [Actinomadura kijaniata]|uniref:DUF397 domain-containing protein n=1 Tax=Actinomadura kijaniata TaxID=46161 RepID=UPI000A0155CA|nr:DUF397 domain-containing protein [Actinomadura kijaniata]